MQEEFLTSLMASAVSAFSMMMAAVSIFSVMVAASLAFLVMVMITGGIRVIAEASL